jgi:hypothetical protein
VYTKRLLLAWKRSKSGEDLGGLNDRYGWERFIYSGVRSNVGIRMHGSRVQGSGFKV